MGLAGFLMHKSAKSSIKKIIAQYEQFTPDQRAGAIFYIWLLRGLNLARVRGTPNVNIPVYFYLKGAEVPLTDVRAEFRDNKNKGLILSVDHHLYTNLAVTCPNEGYGPLVRTMWNILFNDHTDMKEVVDGMHALLHAPQFEEVIINNDVSAEELAENPRSIMPHFLVPGHKLSVTLMENEKIANLILSK